jgi:hypothetical protein
VERVEASRNGDVARASRLAQLLQWPSVEMDTPNSRALTWFAVLVLCLQLTACELAKGIFKAGVWFGVLGVVIVVALVGWGLSRLR